jgi:hypothetical protein
MVTIKRQMKLVDQSKDETIAIAIAETVLATAIQTAIVTVTVIAETDKK